MIRKETYNKDKCITKEENGNNRTSKWNLERRKFKDEKEKDWNEERKKNSGNFEKNGKTREGHNISGIGYNNFILLWRKVEIQ